MVIIASFRVEEGGGSFSVVDLMNMVSGRTTMPLLSFSPVS